MGLVKIATKPKYPTRKLVGKVLFNENDFVEIADLEASLQVNSLLNTSFVAIVSEDEYYPITADNYLEQFELVASGSAPTVESDAKFGIKSVYCFMTAPDSDDAEKIQDNVVVSTGICSGTLFKVTNYKNLAIDEIDKNGFWFAFDFDLDSAEELGYSNLKYHVNGGSDPIDLVSGTNYIFMGKNETEVLGTNFNLQADFTVTEDEISETIEVIKAVDCKFALEVHDEKAEIPAITVDGKEVASLNDAFKAAKSGSRIDINKSFTDESDAVTLSDNRNIIICMNNNAVLTLKNDITILNGYISVDGKGTIQEAEPYRSPIMLKNTDENNNALLYVAEGITLSGYLGIFVGANACNCHVKTYGHLISSKLGDDVGSGLYVNGTAKSGSAFIGGKIESEGHGVYLAGNFDTTIYKADITGVDSAVEIRAGSLNVVDSTLIATSEEEPSMTPNGNGSTAVAVALAVSQHTTNLPISVTVNSSTVKGKAAFMQGNPQENSEVADVSVAIKSGVFLGSIKTLKPETDCTKFISGGKYSERPDDLYIADKFHAEKTSSGAYDVKANSLDDEFVRKLGLRKDAEYLWYAEYNEPIDYKWAQKKIVEYYNNNKANFACSSVQNDLIRGRNFDWNYDNLINLIVVTPAIPGRHAILSLCDPHITEAEIESGKYMDNYRAAPLMLIDGINDAGLIFNSNILPKDDVPATTGTTKGGEDVFMITVGRYILEHCATVAEAVEYIKTLNIFTSAGIGELHYMISDASGEHVIIEVVDNEFKFNYDETIMTNFYNTIDRTPHSEGIERYDILAAGYESATDADSMLELMKQVHYTKMYDFDTEPIWYSEFNGNSEQFGDLTIDSAPEDYAEIIEYAKKTFEERSRDTGETWYTVHTSIYNSEDNSLILTIGEEDQKYNYSI